MGGDHAPDEIVAGALQSGVDVVLVGDQDRIRPLVGDAKVEVVHASEVIGMDEDPGQAIRNKRESSIAVAARLVANGEVDGLVSAGSTGAAMAAAALIIGRLENVARPAIAAVIPSIIARGSGQIVLDVGANPEIKAEHLQQFAVMGDALARTRLNLADPRVGLLNIGEEAGKGRDLERRAYELLEKSSLNFIGNVEGRDLAGDKVDVIVTDGFTGNTLLKTSEGIVRLMIELFKKELGVLALESPELAERLARAAGEQQRRLDPEMYGGATLLGVKGVVTIAHGSSSRVAIASALRMSAEEAEHRLVDLITSGLEE